MYPIYLNKKAIKCMNERKSDIDLSKKRHTFTASDYLMDALKHKDDFENTYFNKKFETFDRKGVMYMSENEKLKKKSKVASDAFKKMSNREREFFVLYNSPNYYDEQLGCRTYLDEVSTYLLTFVDDLDKYIYYTNKNEQPEPNENTEDFTKKLFHKRVNYRFRLKKYFVEVSSRAKAILNSDNFIRATKDIANKLVNDAEFSRSLIAEEIKRIAESELTQDRDKLKAYDLLIKVLGLEKTTTKSDINIVLSGIQSGIELEGINEEDFSVEESDE